MYPYSATDVVRVMNTDLARMLERDRWHRERPEIFQTGPNWPVTLAGLQRRLSRLTRNVLPE